jgi:hypothetical protein
MIDDPVFVYIANRVQGDVTFGGHLVATRSRLTFTPTPENEELGGHHWSTDLSSVREVGKKARTWGLKDGGIRTRLRITMNDGHDELFVVYKAGRAAAELSSLLADRETTQP